MFIDLHCHILPSLDDGADSLIETIDMIDNAQKSGTNILVATPHYNYPDKNSVTIEKADIIETYHRVCSELKKNNIQAKVFLGSELLLNDNIDRLYNSDKMIPVNGSRYMLSEFYFDENIINVYKYTDKLISYGFVPIIAHPERYGFFESDKNSIPKLLEKGCRFQLNKDSFLGRNGIGAKEMAVWMLKNGYVHIVASDCHNSSTRNADMSELYLNLLDYTSQAKAKALLHDNPKRVLLDMNL